MEVGDPALIKHRLTPGYFLHTGPISFKLSNETHAVVPRVVETKNGTYPSATSASIAWNKNEILQAVALWQKSSLCSLVLV